MEIMVAWYVLSTVFLPLAVWSPLTSHPLVIFPGLPIKMWLYVGASKISNVDYIGNNDGLDERFVITGDANIPMVQPGKADQIKFNAMLILSFIVAFRVQIYPPICSNIKNASLFYIQL